MNLNTTLNELFAAGGSITIRNIQLEDKKKGELPFHVNVSKSSLAGNKASGEFSSLEKALSYLQECLESLPLTQNDPLPPGWTHSTIQGYPIVLCRENLIHYLHDGQWLLHVPWFRGEHQKPVLTHIDGSEIIAEIDDKNTITTPSGRKINPGHWNHWNH
jgi:hypothetical protein